MASSITLALAPDDAFVSLQWWRGGQHLVHRLTGEIQRLEAKVPLWEVNRSEDMRAFLSSGAESVWASDIFQNPVYLDTSGDGPAIECVVINGQQVVLTSFLRAIMHDTYVSVGCGPVGACDFEVGGLLRPLDGACIRWPVLGLFRDLGLQCQRGKAWKWALNSFGRWKGFVSEIGLPDSHCISGHTRGGDDDDGDEQDDTHVATDKRFSIHALLALCVRWSSLPRCKGGLADQGDRDKIGAFMEALIDLSSTRGCQRFTLFLDRDASWEPPSCPAGAGPVDIALQGGCLLLTPLARNPSRLARLLVSTLHAGGCWGDGTVSIMSCMAAAIKSETLRHKPVRWFLKQLIWFVGSLADEAVLEKATASVAKPMSELSRAKQDKMLSAYWFSLRGNFGDATTLHVALDGGTLFKKPVVVGIIAKPSNLAMVFPPQVQRCSLTDLHFAKECGTKEEEEVARMGWFQKAKRYLQMKRSGEQISKADLPPTKFRKKTHAWMVSLDNILQKSTGKSLDSWRIDEQPEKRPPLGSWPYLGICPDQGPDGVCANFYMAHKGVCFQMWYDLSHGVWNDQERAVKCVGLQGWSHLMVVVMNLAHSPYQSDARYHALRETTTEWLELAENCPLFASHLPGLIKDYGLEERQHEEGINALVLREMASDWNSRCKGTQVKMCRFGNWVDRGAEFDGSYTFTMLRVLIHGLSENLLDAATLKAVLQPIAADSTEQQERPTMATSNQCVQRFREACRSNLQLAAALLVDPLSRPRLRILYLLVQPLRKWYGDQSTKLRSTVEHKEWLLQQVAEQFSVPLRLTWAQLGDGGKLRKVGFRTRMWPEEVQCVPDHPSVAQEQTLARAYGGYILSLIASRARRTMYLWKGWTGQQARFCDPSAIVRDRAAQALLMQSDALAIVENRSEGFWTRLSKRCVLRTTAMQQLIGLLKAEPGTVSEELRRVVSERISGIGQSKVSEDAMNVGRRVEAPAANKLQGAPRVLWRSLIDSKLSNGLFRYQEPDWERQRVPPGANGKLPDNLFRTDMRSSPKWLKGVVGSKSRADWYSTSADGSAVQYADLAVLEAGMETRQWADIAKGAFLGALCQETFIIKPPRKTDWYIVLGNLFGEAVLAWPAIAFNDGRQLVSVEPDPQGAPVVLVVYCHRTWTAAKFEWRSPWAQVLHGDISPADASGQPKISMSIVQQPAPLIEIAARSAFAHMTMTQLNLLCKFLGVRTASDDTLWTRLDAMLKEIFPNIAAEEVEEIISQRLSPTSDWDEFILQDKFEDFIDQKDLKKFQEQKQNTESNMQSVNAIRREWVEFKAARLASRSRETRRSSAPREYVNIDGENFPESYPDTDMSAAEAQKYSPHPIRVYKDMANMRWQAYYPPIASRSRAFSLYGPALALKLILRWAWSERLLRDGLTVESCPIRGLFDATVEAPAAAPAQASSSSARARAGR